MTLPDPLRLVDACYAAALDASLWPGVLDQVSACLGARGTVIVSQDPRRTADTLHSDSLREVHAAYSGGWWEHDTRIARARSFGMRPGLIVADPMLFSPGDKRKDPFFQDFCAQHGLDELMAFCAPDPGGGLMSVSALREARKGYFEAGEIALLAQVGPHVARAFDLTTRLGVAHRAAADLGTALARAEIGVVLLDRGGAVRFVNPGSERMVAGRLKISPGQPVRTVVAADGPRLDRLVAAALAEGRFCAAEPIILRSSDGSPCLLAEAMPLRAGEPGLELIGSTKGGALLLLHPMTPPDLVSIAPQLEQLGLTRMQALVAMAIGRGSSPREAAESLAIREGTVRVHLKAIFGRLGLRRQSELAIIVARLDAILSRRREREGGTGC
ncbi:helix-turn-helix transcriptional regulator [Methylobacterium sp. Leaf93]|uniref:helix-turn-helix transcriptional regulator n=1 Tax=Methylobacterium sp. Leaf93 TaxID=1736249 RepID=UPI0006FE6BA3|nr:helix-turn-helix transcriptional regulator [Methylobacterium sp. Leaf93]KQP14640.1 hypothetical protein ASF26_17905 [Methylobacterium sp. Leaf93]